MLHINHQASNIRYSMATKVVRVSEDAIEITGRYAKDISEGIRMMQKLIEEKSTPQIDMKALEKMMRDCIAEEFENLQRGY
ncbi:hypothetical protein Mlab_0833 [Methanocorpusculum labreanum Z]|uniref:Uncharacterized protein n=2 Tax=Methanocorpusculum labreanum TaxID=83984 RepID=A2SRP8_METLZ|nr:hypothetical protein Mlab_0833 [Methanocorpusculum labreanum Z]